MVIPSQAMIPATHMSVIEIAVRGMRILFIWRNIQKSTMRATKNEMGRKTGHAKGVSTQHGSGNGDLIDSFEESVRQTLQRALDLTNGDIPETAKRLKLSRSSFYRMVQKYGLTKPVPKG